MKLFHLYMAIFVNFSPTSSHLHPLQGENCDSNSRLVVDEDDNGEFRLERVKRPSLNSCVDCLESSVYNFTVHGRQNRKFRPYRRAILEMMPRSGRQFTSVSVPSTLSLHTAVTYCLVKIKQQLLTLRVSSYYCLHLHGSIVVTS